MNFSYEIGLGKLQLFSSEQIRKDLTNAFNILQGFDSVNKKKPFLLTKVGI